MEPVEIRVPEPLGAGTMTRHLARVGEIVRPFAPLCELISFSGEEIELTAPCGGRVSAILQIGHTALAGAPVARIVPAERPAPRARPEQPPNLRARPRLRARRPRVRKLTICVLDTQIEALRARAAKLEGYALAELQRVMVDLLLALPDAELIKRLEAQRDTEQRGYYGFGGRVGA